MNEFAHARPHNWVEAAVGRERWAECDGNRCGEGSLAMLTDCRRILVDECRVSRAVISRGAIRSNRNPFHA